MANLEQITFIKLAGKTAEIIDAPRTVTDKHGLIHEYTAFQDVEEGVRFTCMAKVGQSSFTPIWDSIEVIQDADTQNLAWYKYGNVYISPQEKQAFDVIAAIMDEGGHVNLTCVGLSGFGKTSRAVALANALDYELVIVDVGSIQTMRDWWYTREVTNGETVDRLTELAKKLPYGKLVVLLDDNNRANPALHNSLMPILDFRRAITVVHQRIEVGPSVVFMQTLNEGYGFVGTQNLDIAFVNRFDMTLEVTEPPKEIEEEIVLDRYNLNGQTEDIVKLVREMRLVKEITDAADVSTRTTLKLAKLVYYGMPIGGAFRMCLANGKDQQVKVAIDDVLKGI